MVKTFCMVGDGQHWLGDTADDARRVVAGSLREGKVVVLSLGDCLGGSLPLEGYIRFGRNGKLARRGPEFPHYIPINVQAFLWKPPLEQARLLDSLYDSDAYREFLESGPSLLE
ncbi:MAG: hypothetical protein O2854_09405 [Chloroflexi bacterium]|nr:hypothetical protein [Chloroflexota bacterium]